MTGRFAGKNPKNQAKEIRRILWNLWWAEKFACEVIGAPYSTSFLAKRPFINFFHLGRAAPNIDSASPARESSKKGVMRILHAPSSREMKGTDIIVKAVEKLNLQNRRLDLTIVEGYDNSKLTSLIPDFDLVIDQVYSDVPMGALASECVHLGVPVMVGGYGLSSLASFMPNQVMPPTIIFQPDDLEKRLEEIIDSRSVVDSHVQKYPEYLREYRSSLSTGRNFLAILKGNHSFPKVDPQEVRYFEGMGQSRTITAEQILEVYRLGGLKAMGLKSKPELGYEVVEWAKAQAGQQALPSPDIE